jgi:thymidylate synthase
MSKEEYVDKIKTDDEFAKKWGDLGPIYGKQWRSWTNDNFHKYVNSYDRKTNEPQIEHKVKQIDQITNLINDLKTNPDSRRLMVNAWNVGELDQMVLPPCHYGFQVYTRELSLEERHQLALPIWKKKYGPLADMMVLTNVDNTPYKIPTRAISLMWNQRSVDTFLGLPFNIASYGLLLEIIAKEVNMVPDELIGNLGDVHLYSNHVEQAKEQIGRELSLEERRKMVTQEMFNQIYNGGGPESLSHSEIDQWNIPRIELRKSFPLPTLKIGDEVVWAQYECLPSYSIKDFTLENYQSHPTIKAPLSN